MFTEFKRFLKQIFQEANGKYSSKRTIALLAFVFLVVAGSLNLAYNIVVAEFIFDGFMWIALGGAGIVLGERVATAIQAKIEKAPTE